MFHRRGRLLFVAAAAITAAAQGQIPKPVAVEALAVEQSTGSGSIVNETLQWGEFFVGGVAPIELGGVTVMVNGVPAPIAFTGLSADFEFSDQDQINFVTPDSAAQGPVTVEVFKDGEMVATTMVNLGSFAPALFAVGSAVRDGNTFLAVTAADFTILLPPELFPGSAVRPARQGETIVLFGTGFGGTEPEIPVGRIVTELATLTNDVGIRIGDLDANVVFAGLAPNLADVYQFNVTVPDALPDGDAEVRATIGGVETPAGFVIPVQRDEAVAALGRSATEPAKELSKEARQSDEPGAVLQGSAPAPISLVHGATFEAFDAGRTLAPNTFATIFGPTMSPGPTLSISNLEVDSRLANDGEAIIFEVAFDFVAPEGNIVWTGQFSTSAKVEAVLSAPGLRERCAYAAAGPPLDLPGVTSGRFEVRNTPEFDEEDGRLGMGMFAITLIDAAGARSNTLEAAVPVEPICPENSPIEELLFPPQ